MINSAGVMNPGSTASGVWGQELQAKSMGPKTSLVESLAALHGPSLGTCTSNVGGHPIAKPPIRCSNLIRSCRFMLNFLLHGDIFRTSGTPNPTWAPEVSVVRSPRIPPWRPAWSATAKVPPRSRSQALPPRPTWRWWQWSQVTATSNCCCGIARNMDGNMKPSCHWRHESS